MNFRIGHSLPLSAYRGREVHNNVLVEKPLGELNFKFEAVNEWKKEETTIETIRDGAIYSFSFTWLYKLTPRRDGSYSLAWRLEKEGRVTGSWPPLIIPVYKNQYPKNLVLMLMGEFKGDEVVIKDLRLKLK